MNLQIDQSILAKASALKVTTFSQFYECAEFQMIKLFESLYGANTEIKMLTSNHEEEKKAYREEISAMLTSLANQLNFHLNSSIKEALVVNLLMHSLIPKGEDNLVLRDYFNPVLMNHFNFYMYLSEYLHLYKDLICVSDLKDLRSHMKQVAAVTHVLVMHTINLASVEHIIDKVVDDWGHIIEFRKEIKAKQAFVKFDKNDCKHNFDLNYQCSKSGYVKVAMQTVGRASNWIQEQIVKDKVPVHDVDQTVLRFYMYRFLEKEFFALDVPYRACVPAHIRCAVHSCISDLVEKHGSYMKTRLPSIPFGSIKARDIPLWVEMRLQGENWLKIYRNRNSHVFADLATLKALEMNLVRDQPWDSKTKTRTLQAVISLVRMQNKQREKAIEKMKEAADYCFK